ncbi:MAG: hypothetical protein ACYC26_09455 [Phycisphaerales bacterium]
MARYALSAAAACTVGAAMGGCTRAESPWSQWIEPLTRPAAQVIASDTPLAGRPMFFDPVSPPPPEGSSPESASNLATVEVDSR